MKQYSAQPGASTMNFVLRGKRIIPDHACSEIRISCSGFSRVTLMSEDPRSITISPGVLLNNELIHPEISLQRYFTPKPKSQNGAHTIRVIHIGLCHSRGLIVWLF